MAEYRLGSLPSEGVDEEDGDNDEEILHEQIIPTVNDMKIKFDVIDTKLVEDGDEKFTVYTILVMKMATLDNDQAVIQRRYSDFDQLHKGLRKECPEVMKNVPFPRKKLFSLKFHSQIVEKRSRMFEKYLRYICHQPEVIESTAFQNFFFITHLRQATEYLIVEENEKSYQEYKLALNLQNKLGANETEELMIIAMCGLVYTSKNLKYYEQAERFGERCLNVMLYDLTNPFLLGLLESVIEVKKRLGKPTGGVKSKMKECLRKCYYEEGSIQSLKVLLVGKRYGHFI